MSRSIFVVNIKRFAVKQCLKQLAFGFLFVMASLSKGAAFQNLDFEQSPITPDSAYQTHVPTTILFPNWTLSFDDRVQGYGTSNIITLGGAPQGVLYSYSDRQRVIQGSHSADLEKGAYGASVVSLSQTGDIPIDTRSVRFTARDLTEGSYDGALPATLVVSVNAQPLTVIALARSGFDVQYAADVTHFAGTTASLLIGVKGAAVTTANPFGIGSAEIDDIQFSSQLVPEPAVNALIAAGIGCAALRSPRRNPSLQL